MYNPQELQRKAQLNLHGIDTTAKTSLSNNNPPKQENNKSFLATIGNFVNNVVMGAVKSIEGIVDAGAMLVGLFGAEVDDFVSYDFTSDVFGTDEEGEGLLDWSWGKSLSEVSYLDNDNIVNQIAEGVGGMLPAIAVNFIPGVGQALSTAMFIGGASGNASEQALKEGATYGQALGYGAIAGAIEGVTEKIGGRIFGKSTDLSSTLLGKLAIKTGTDKVISKGVGKVAYSFTSEGLEEVLADVFDVANRKITGVEKDATIDWKQLPKTFLIGGSVGALLDGMQKGASAVRNKDKGGKHFVKVAEDLEDISNTNKALAYLQQHKGITQERLNNATIRSSERTMDSIEKISEELQSMTNEQRKLAFDTLRENTSFVDDNFNSDGTIKEETRNDYAEVMNDGAIYNVSTDLVYKGKSLENEIKAVNEQHEMNLELSDTAFTENQRKSFAKINRSVAKLNEKIGERISIVAIKDNPNANAFIDKNTIYINEKYLEDGQWARYLSHEVSHFAKKSKEFNSFAQYITSDDKVLADVVLKVDGAYKYDFDLNTAKEVISKVKKGEKVSERESEFYDEVVAHITEDLFTNEESVNRLVKNNSSLAQKILNRIKQFLQIFKGTNADSKTVINLRKAEMLFEKALSSIGKQNKELTERYEKSITEYKKAKKKYDVLSEEQRESWLKENNCKAEDFSDDVLDDGNELDNSGEIKYSYKARDPKTVTEKDFKHHYWAVANNLLSKEEIGVLNSAVGNISRGEVYNKNSDGFFMIPVGEKGILNKIIFTDGKKGSYSINSIIEIACDNETDLTDIRSVVYARERNGIHTENSDLFKIYYSKDFRYNDFIAKIQNYSQDSNREQDGTRSGRKTKFSLKDSEISDIKFSLREELELFHEIEIENENEYRRLEKEIKRRNGNHPAEFEWATTDRYLYIVRNNTLDSFSPILRIDCKKHEKLFMRLIRMIDLSNYSSEQTIRNWLDEICSHPDFFEWINLDLSSSVKSELAVTSDEKNNAVYNKFDSKGTELTDYQIDFFSESHARDRYGRLRVVYHGTLNEFFVFDKSLLGKNFPYNKDAKLGFFFTASYPLAGDYSVHAKEQQRYRILEETAHGDEKLLNFLLDKGNFESYDKVKKYLDKKTYDEIKEIDRKLENNENEIVSVYLNIKNPYIENWDRQAHYTTNVIRAIQKAKANNHDGVIIKRIDASVNQARPAADLYIVFEPNQIKLTTNKNPTSSSDIRFSKKITADMTDSERYEILKDKAITVLEKTGSINYSTEIKSLEELHNKAKSKAEKIIMPLAQKLGILNKSMKTPEIEIDFILSKNGGLAESLNQQLRYGGNYADFAKVIINLDKVLENAVLIEKHSDKYIGTIREDANLEEVYVLVSAIQEDESIIPVQLEIKKYSHINGRLYLTVALTKIKASVVGSVLDKSPLHSLILASKYSLANIFKNVNPIDKHFLKYIPDGFLNKEQIQAKQEALKEDGIKIRNLRYLKLVENPIENENKIRELVKEAASEAGYSIKAYHGTLAKDFTEFKKSFIGSSFSFDDKGFFFIDRKSIADDYSRSEFDSGKKGSVIEAYLKIKKPLVVDNNFAIKEGLGKIYRDNDVIDVWDNYNTFLLEEAENKKADGIILNDGMSKMYVVFNSNQIKSAEAITYDNKGDIIPLSERFNDKKTDIRFSLKANPTYTLSDGQITKKMADISKPKFYKKKEALEVVNDIIGGIDLGNGLYVETTKKNVEEIATELWQIMNTSDSGKRVGVSEKIADFLIDSLVVKDMFENGDFSDDLNIISAIRPYLHNIELSTIKDEIKHRFDKDNSVYLLWGNRKGENGFTADQIAIELEESGIHIDANNQAEIFFEIDRMYRDAVKSIKTKKVDFLKEQLSEEERQELKTQIALEIEASFEKYGSKSKFAEILETSNKWKTLYNSEIDRNRAENNLVFEIERLETAKNGAVTDYVDTVFNQSIGLLTRLKFKNSFNRSGARNIIQNLIEWAKNPKNLIFTKDEKFNQVILPKMEMIAGNTSIGMSENGMAIINKLSKECGLSSIGEIYKWYTKDNVGKDYNFLVKKLLGIYANEKKFSVNEIKALSDIVHYFRNYLEETKQIRLNDKLIESKDLVEKFVGQIDYNLTRKYTGAQRIYLASMFNQNRKREYYRYFMDGKSIARVMDRYEDGVCTFMMNQLEQGEVTRAITSMSELNELNNFYKKHKKFEKKIEDKTVKYLNEEIPLGSAMFLYMQLRSEDAITSLMASGFSYTQKNGLRKDVPGFNPELFNDESATKEQANKLREELEKQFDAEDKEFILICEDLFNNKLRRLKVKTDEKMLGFSNVIDGYYVPKYVSDMSKKIENYDDEIASVSNQSFNKSRIKGAYGRLKIESLSNVIKRHSEAVIKYYSFAEIERNINIVRNLDVGKDEHNVKTVNTEMSKVWKSFNNYFEKLYKDIRGITTKESYGLLESVRSGYVKSVLGFNPKVLVNQLSSYISAGHILDYKSLVKGLFVKSTKNDIDKYCQLAEYRREENVSAQSQGLINDASSKLLSGIGFIDSVVIKQELGACQVQVQKDTGLKIGTEENKFKAGELLQKVILETQQNSFMTSQTEASRSSNTGLKWLTSFKADAIKSFGRWVDSLGMLLFAKEGEARSKAKKKFIASSSTIILQAVYLATITSLFNKFFNKDDDEEDENKALNFIVDAITNLFGGLPILGDVINSLTSGFDMEDMSYGVINDVIDSTRNVIDLFDGNTDSREVARGVRSVIYSISSVMGIPTKNIYKLIYGTTNLISPESAYKMDDFFYKQSYSKDLKKAILNEDDKMISVIVGLMTDENVGYFENSSTRQEINRLVKADFDVLPQSITNTMTINDTQYTLTETEKDEFRKVYEKSITAVDKLVSSNGYKIATDEAKAKAIKYVYRYYYYEAQHQALNVDLDSKLYLFGQIVPIEKMALALAEVPLLVENSTNKKKTVQRYLQATKLSSAQKYMLMGYFGYKNTKGEGVVKSAINKTSLTKEQKKLLLEKCGY